MEEKREIKGAKETREEKGDGIRVGRQDSKDEDKRKGKRKWETEG